MWCPPNVPWHLVNWWKMKAMQPTLTVLFTSKLRGCPWEWMISTHLILLLICSNHSAFSFHWGGVTANLDYDYALTRSWSSDCQHFDKHIHLHYILVVWMAKLIFGYWFLVFPVEKITLSGQRCLLVRKAS